MMTNCDISSILILLDKCVCAIDFRLLNTILFFRYATVNTISFPSNSTHLIVTLNFTAVMSCTQPFMVKLCEMSIW